MAGGIGTDLAPIEELPLSHVYEIVMVKVAVAVSLVWGLVVALVSSTSTVNVDVMLRLVGVPEITPVDLSSLSPLGGLPDPEASFQV